MPANALEYLERENVKRVRLLERNRDASAFILAFIDHLVDYSNRRGVLIEDIIIDRPFIEGYASGEGEYLRARITHR